MVLRKRWEQESNKELNAFTYSVSHDLKAPLRAISGFAEIISSRHRADLNEQGQHYFDNIVEASRQLERLINDLLSYSRIGQRVIKLQPVNLQEVMGRINLQLAPQLEEAAAELIIADNLPTVLGDETLLHQIFLNLLDNAILYRREGIKLQIEVNWHRNGQHAIVTVQDNGIGIAEEFQNKIFQIFQRLHSDETPGSGIGLAIVKKATQLLGGEITIESTVDQGSTFSVRLQSPDSDRDAYSGEEKNGA